METFYLKLLWHFYNIQSGGSQMHDWSSFQQIKGLHMLKCLWD